MIARTLEELVVWQLACELSDRVTSIMATQAVQRDGKLCAQLADAANSVTANIAEGFGRYRPREFAQFARYAKASAYEIRAHVRDAHKRGYIDGETLVSVSNLSRRIVIALARLIVYLDGCPPDGPVKRASRTEHRAPNRSCRAQIPTRSTR